eukprot:758749-Hanusia_phi.AAC.4
MEKAGIEWQLRRGNECGRRMSWALTPKCRQTCERAMDGCRFVHTAGRECGGQGVGHEGGGGTGREHEPTNICPVKKPCNLNATRSGGRWGGIQHRLTVLQGKDGAVRTYSLLHPPSVKECLCEGGRNVEVAGREVGGCRRE